MTITNAAPAATLELTEDQAQFLMNNCNSNIRLALGMLQNARPDTPRTTLEKIISHTENFKAIREMLLKQGIQED